MNIETIILKLAKHYSDEGRQLFAYEISDFTRIQKATIVRCCKYLEKNNFIKGKDCSNKDDVEYLINEITYEGEALLLEVTNQDSVQVRQNPIGFDLSLST